MCFSPAASFAAGAGLAVVGTVTLRKVRQRREIAFAAIPMLFAVQQLTEGVVWLTFRYPSPLLNAVSTNIYSLFSHVLWPIYVPLAVLLIEPVKSRRRIVLLLQAAGVAVGLYLLVFMILEPIKSMPMGGHIVYMSPHFFIGIVMTLYLAGTCVSMLVSTHIMAKVFGVVAILSFLLSYLYAKVALVSVWCFFAAVLSVIVYLHFMLREIRVIEPAPHLSP